MAAVHQCEIYWFAKFQRDSDHCPIRHRPTIYQYEKGIGASSTSVEQRLMQWNFLKATYDALVLVAKCVWPCVFVWKSLDFENLLPASHLRLLLMITHVRMVLWVMGLLCLVFKIHIRACNTDSISRIWNLCKLLYQFADYKNSKKNVNTLLSQVVVGSLSKYSQISVCHNFQLQRINYLHLPENTENMHLDCVLVLDFAIFRRSDNFKYFIYLSHIKGWSMINWVCMWIGQLNGSLCVTDFTATIY